MMISVSTLTLEGTLSKLSGLLLILLNGSLVNASQVVDQMTCRRRFSCQHREMRGEEGQYYVYTICFTFDNTKQADSKHPIEMERRYLPQSTWPIVTRLMLYSLQRGTRKEG